MRYEISGLGATSDIDIVAGFDLVRSLRKIGKTVTRAAPAVLPVASFIPGVWPAALAASAALRIADAARRGAAPARVAMNMLGQRADRGDAQAQRWLALFTQAMPMLDARQIRQLALLARKGVPQAQAALATLASAADDGNVRAQRAFEGAAGTYRIDDDIEAGGATFFEQFLPHRGYWPDSKFFTARDAYYDGLRVLRKEAETQPAAVRRS